MKKFDFLILGSGIAGMSAAILLSRIGSVALVSKTKLISGSTPLAQGGIALSDKNDANAHVSETQEAGRFFNEKSSVQQMIDSVPTVRTFLEQECGIVFDADIHREGGHSVARIFHCADHTGQTIAQKLAEKIRANTNISLFEHHFAIELIIKEKEGLGAFLFDGEKVEPFLAKETILATGGAGQIFSETTNPPEATGDGIAMAIHAGISCRNLEFIQFHPTVLLSGDSPLFLLSEALRGEGAEIRDAQGNIVCDPLLPRDEVARAIFFAQEKIPVFLDLRHRSNDFWKSRFPTIFSKISEVGFSPEKDLIPIAPAEHFFCGGIATDLSGKTNIAHIFAGGEVAESGVHGANRLASNSLLEAISFALTLSQNISPDHSSREISPHDFPLPPFFPETQNDLLIRAEIQKIMTQNFGIVREQKRMKAAYHDLCLLSPVGTETKNCLMVARAVAVSALGRPRSLGTHFLLENQKS